MTFGRTRIEFLHDLLDRHADDQIEGYCLRCHWPFQFFPCDVRIRVVAELVRSGHIPEADRAAVEKGKLPCP